MGASIKAWDLTFVDLSEDKVGDFSYIDPYNDSADAISKQNLDTFFASPIGQAQRESLVEEMTAQMKAQGVDNYEPAEQAIITALRSGQTSQNFGTSPGVTNEMMLENHGPDWLDKIGTLASNFLGAASGTASELGHDGLGQVVDGVKNNGLSGEAHDALANRQGQLDDAINTQSVPGM